MDTPQTALLTPSLHLLDPIAALLPLLPPSALLHAQIKALERAGLRTIADVVRSPEGRPGAPPELGLLREVALRAAREGHLQIPADYPCLALLPPLPKRTLRILHEEGVRTAGDLRAALRGDRLLRTRRNYGLRSRDALQQAVLRLGLTPLAATGAESAGLGGAGGSLTPFGLPGRSGQLGLATLDCAGLIARLLTQGIDADRPIWEIFPDSVGDPLRRSLAARDLHTLGEVLRAVDSGELRRHAWVSALLRDLEVLAAGSDPDADADIDAPQSIGELIELALRSPRLTERERDVIRRRCAGQELGAIAADYGVSREAVRQRESWACARLLALRVPAQRLLATLLEAADETGGLLRRADAIEMAQEPDLCRLRLALRLSGRPFMPLGRHFLYEARRVPLRARAEALRTEVLGAAEMPLAALAARIDDRLGLRLGGALLRQFTSEVLGLRIEGDVVLGQPGRLPPRLSRAVRQAVAPQPFGSEQVEALFARTLACLREESPKGPVSLSRLTAVLRGAGLLPRGISDPLLIHILCSHPEVERAGRHSFAICPAGRGGRLTKDEVAVLEATLRASPQPLSVDELRQPLSRGPAARWRVRWALSRAPFALHWHDGRYLHGEQLGLSREQQEALLEAALRVLPQDGAPLGMRFLIWRLGQEDPTLALRGLPNREDRLYWVLTQDPRLRGEGGIVGRAGPGPRPLVRAVVGTLGRIGPARPGPLVRILRDRYHVQLTTAQLRRALGEARRLGLLCRLRTREYAPAEAAEAPAATADPAG